jgi:hypothetical protein
MVLGSFRGADRMGWRADVRSSGGERARIVDEVRNARYPNFVAFIGTGVVIGAVVGGLISTMSDNAATTFSESSALGYMIVVFALVGAFLGALAGVIADILITRREGR